MSIRSIEYIRVAFNVFFEWAAETIAWSFYGQKEALEWRLPRIVAHVSLGQI